MDGHADRLNHVEPKMEINFTLDSLRSTQYHIIAFDIEIILTTNVQSESSSFSYTNTKP